MFLSSIILAITTLLLLGGGIYFSIKLGFPQLKWEKLFIGLKTKEETKITPLKSLMISLAAKIGVGSIAGIALAIYIGGPGTIFWIWIIGIITSINTYCESYLGVKYQVKKDNFYCGGPSYYISKGLNNKILAKIYAILIILAYIIGFMTIQANTITVAINNYYHINTIIIAIFLSLISFFSILKGLKTVVSITSKIVPLMGISYVLLSLLIIFKNINIIPNIIIIIIKDAWNIKSLTAGFIPSFLIGMKRGVFSTEAGLGTGSIASSTVYSKNKVNISLIQIIGIYFTVFVVCTGTAFIILSSNYQHLIISNINGIELTQYALNYHLGKYGSIVLIISVIFLAYSTIVAGYYYGESSLNFLLKNNKKSILCLKILTVILLFIGSLMSANIIWSTVDILVELLAIINMYTILKLRKEIIFDYHNST